MRWIFLFLVLVPMQVRASFLLNYGLNYSSEKESSDDKYEKSRTFHKLYLGASVNSTRTLFFGWNINSWSSAVEHGTSQESTYSLLEMGPRAFWFLSENYNFFLTAEWNPYARGDREKNGQKQDISGGSFGAGVGYRFKINRFMGLGASLHYHTLTVKEQKIDSTETNVSDKVTNLMPMLELSILTR
jgi:hypothetical protein